MKLAFVFWAPPEACPRGKRFALALHAEAVFSHKNRLFGFKLPAPIRYVAQAVHTWRTLRRIRPEAVLVQTPPPFATALVCWYCVRRGIPFVTDNHTSAFLDPRWRIFHFLDRWLARRAALNLAHNEANLEILQSWGAQGPTLMKSPAAAREELMTTDGDTACFQASLDTDALKVFMVNRFAEDDAFPQVFETARRMPEARFFVTGDPARAGKRFVEAPDNVVITGFLDPSVFLRLMDACDVVLSLTLRPDTLLWSIRECLALGKPFVTSDSRVIHLEFDGYGVFTNHEPADIGEKILEAHRGRDTFVPKMAEYIVADKRRWAAGIAEIVGVLEAANR